MDQFWRARTSSALWIFMLLALAYSWLLFTFGPLVTGEPRYDGALGVVIGLYVCSHPASNVLDLLFMEGGAVRGRHAQGGGIGWYLLNLLVLLAGWLAVFLGVVQFTTR
jgi:hypothetical protein